ncbi:MAG: hypothetical protein BGO49_04560 [Planctomycetales bacterium 71-10]|nr:MAG: hypothetical protein BGO49_04560 [Planctomycetales bacterium 71-10]
MHSDRLIARRRRPLFDVMEERQLLTTFVMVDNPRALEGTGAPTAMTFTVKLVVASTSTVQVSYATQDRTAQAGSDYVATSGTLTFAPGETVKSVAVPLVPDAIPESNEAFVLNLSNPVNAAIFTPVGSATIVDDDIPVAPALSIADVQTTRGLSGAKTMNFTIRLNGAQKTPITVTAATANLTAIAGKDYLAKTELLTFAAGETVKTFSVTMLGTAAAAPDTIFTVTLSKTTAALSRATAFGIMRYGA